MSDRRCGEGFQFASQIPEQCLLIVDIGNDVTDGAGHADALGKWTEIKSDHHGPYPTAGMIDYRLFIHCLASRRFLDDGPPAAASRSSSGLFAYGMGRNRAEARSG